ncbi:sulfite exporter TauE/SafE family protein [Galenea microaerophila]
MEILNHWLNVLGSHSLYLTAFLVGLLGGVHCLGMCGGVVGSLTFSLKPSVQTHFARMFPYQLAYNLGRISSYMVLGAVFGLLGASLTNLAAFLPAQQLLQWLAGLFMIALGLYLGGWWYGVVAIEKVGAQIWQKLQPLTQRFNRIETLPQAYLYGMLWGWLPCGLVYSMLIMALSAGSAFKGALVMGAFGLGTLPNLLLMGTFAFLLTKWSRKLWVRRLAGASVILLGLWQIYLATHVHIQ